MQFLIDTCTLTELLDFRLVVVIYMDVLCPGGEIIVKEEKVNRPIEATV